MKNMNRNKRKVGYQLYLGKQQILDENGNKTGECKPLYSNKVIKRFAVSAPSGFTYMESFGNLEEYDRIVLIDDMSIPVNQKTIFYIDDVNGDNYDYDVYRVRPTLNVIAVAVRKVKTSG